MSAQRRVGRTNFSPSRLLPAILAGRSKSKKSAGHTGWQKHHQKSLPAILVGRSAIKKVCRPYWLAEAPSKKSAVHAGWQKRHQVFCGSGFSLTFRKSQAEA